MPIVDASVAIKWIVTEPNTAAARALIGPGTAPLSAPALVLIEAHYAIAKLFLRGRATQEQVAEAVPVISGLLSAVPLSEELARDAANISLMGGGHPINIYDCAYIALALTTAQELITADAMQAAVARRVGVAARML